MNVTEAARVWVATKIKLAKLGPEEPGAPA